MRLSILVVSLSSIIGQIYALASNSAYLWTIDTGAVKQESSQVRSASSKLAHAVLARRRGAFSALNLQLDAPDLANVQNLGGYQFDNTADASAQPEPVKLFISISNFEGTISTFDSLPDLWIEEPGADLSSVLKLRDNPEGMCEHDVSPKTKPNVRVIYHYRSETGSCLTARELMTVPSLIAITSTVPGPDTIGGAGITSFLRTLKHLAAVETVESTLLVLPTSTSAKPASGKSEL